MTKQLSKRFLLIGALVLVVGLMGCMMAGCSRGSSNADANLKEQSLPANGAVLTGSSNGNAAVEVKTAPGENAYVKVKTMSGGTKVGFFIRGGSTAEVRVPAGTYSVQFATGKTWYGESDRFGSNTGYGQDPSVSLTDGDIVTYTLQPSTAGNFSMSHLDGSDF